MEQKGMDMGIGRMRWLLRRSWVLLAVAAGCGSLLSGGDGTSGRPSPIVISTTTGGPIPVVAGGETLRVAVVASGEASTADAGSRAVMAIAPEAIVIDRSTAAPRTTQQVVQDELVLMFDLADADVDAACAASVDTAEFVVTVEGDVATSVEAVKADLGAAAVAVIRTGQFGLCTRVAATFTGSVSIDRIDIQVTPPAETPTGGNGNDNGSGNANTNSANANDNGNDNGNANDNGAGAGNENDNSAGADDDNANGDDDGGNANGDDDDSNTNGDDDGNANGDDDDGNANGDDDNGNGNGDDDHDTVNANGDDGSNANAGGGNNANGGGDNVELEAHLFGAGGAAGEVRYRVEGDRRRFEIEVEGVAAGAYDVSIGGVVVASLSVGSYGDGSLELDTLDGTFPAGFPDQVNAADVVSVGDVLSGALQLDDS